MATTIQVSEETRERLARLKSSPRETYDELLGKLLALIPEGDEEGRDTEHGGLPRRASGGAPGYQGRPADPPS